MMLVSPTRTSKLRQQPVKRVKTKQVGWLTQPKDKALLAKLCRLPQVYPRQRRGLPTLQTGEKIKSTQATRQKSNIVLYQFYLAYRSLCPSGWVARWNDQREAGNFPVDLEH